LWEEIVSQTDPPVRRGTWAARERRAMRRLILYSNVMVEIGRQRSQGGSPLELVWRLPDVEIHRLFETAGQAVRILGRSAPPDVRQEQTIRLEQCLDRLVAADDWTRRLRVFLERLRHERARRALSQLARLGCVPHDLVRCVENFTDEGGADAVKARRREIQAYLPRLRRLAESYERLATECEDYNKLKEHYGGTTFRLDHQIAAFLRDEAAMMGAFIRDGDARRHEVLTMANAHLMTMLRDIKTITGEFQDTLVAEFLNGVPGIRMTAYQLRQMRNRHKRRGKAWQPPRYLSRPPSRIVMDVPPMGKT
jgi:hypothetical protein